MANFKGKRMVEEDLIKKLEDIDPSGSSYTAGDGILINDGVLSVNYGTGLDVTEEGVLYATGGGGTTYTAGEGITIDANDEISANIKAGSGIVVDTDLTDDSVVVMIDQEDIPYKSDLATVATTGDYDDLVNKPTIPTISDVTSQITSDNPINKINYSGGAIKFQFLKDEGALETSDTKLTLVDGVSGKYDTTFNVVENTDYTVSGNTMTFSSTDFQNAVCRTLVAATNHNHAFGWKVYAGTSSGIASGTPAVSSNTYTYTGNFSFVFTDNLDGTFTITTPLSITLTVAPTTSVLFSKFPIAANLVKQMDAKFIPIDNSTITVDRNGKLTASGGGGSSYTFTNGLTETSGTVSWDLNDRIKVNSNNSLYINTTTGYPLTNNSSSSSGIAIGYAVNTDENIPSNSVGLYLIGNTKFSQNKKYSNNFTLGLGNKLYSTSSSPTQDVRGQLILGYQNEITSNYDSISNLEGSVSIGSKNVITQNNGNTILEYGRGLNATTSSNGGKIILGTYNNDGEYLFQLGNGTSDSNRSNAMTVAWDGTIVSKNLPAVDTTTDGTYVLKATVSSGVVTYAWVLEV